MTPRLPMCCSPEAFRLLSAQLSAIDSTDALLRGATAIAMHQMQGVEWASVDAQLNGYAQRVRSRVRGAQPQALLAHLHAVLFEEEAFAGNSEDYYNAANSYLPAVLQNKRGLPITLCLIYKAVAERLGFQCWGVGLPGHFLAGISAGEEAMLIDPFGGGRVMSAEEAQHRMHEVLGDEVEWSDDLLGPASHRHWLTRILQNLLNLFGSTGHYADVAAMLEMEILLWPEQVRLQRDLALVLARVGLAQPASAWLSKYLASNPDDPQRSDLKQLLSVLSE